MREFGGWKEDGQDCLWRRAAHQRRDVILIPEMEPFALSSAKHWGLAAYNLVQYCETQGRRLPAAAIRPPPSVCPSFLRKISSNSRSLRCPRKLGFIWIHIGAIDNYMGIRKTGSRSRGRRKVEGRGNLKVAALRL